MNSQRPRQCLVLLVEDDADTYELYSDVLASAGFSVIGADNGDDAVARAIEQAPDIIVMDYDLHGMDGASATALLKRDPRTRHIPVMMLTGHVALRQLERARSAGCDAFLAKPCSLERLLEEARRLTHAVDGMGRAASVLVIDDDDDVRESIAALLSEDGFDVTQANNGRQALELLRGEALPDVILLDLMMPVMDGWTFRSLQLADARLAQIPVVILSATKDVPDACHALDVAEFLRKPFDAPSLLDAIGRQLGCTNPTAH